MKYKDAAGGGFQHTKKFTLSKEAQAKADGNETITGYIDGQEANQVHTLAEDGGTSMANTMQAADEKDLNDIAHETGLGNEPK